MHLQYAYENKSVHAKHEQKPSETALGYSTCVEVPPKPRFPSRLT
jgi:hypothetical protein